MEGEKIDKLTYVTTQRCIIVSREEVPDRPDPAPGQPYYFEVSSIPLSAPKSRTQIWAKANNRSLVITDPSGKKIEFGGIQF